MNTATVLSSILVFVAAAAPMSAQQRGTQTPNGTTTRASSAEAPDYRLVPGDKLRIEVYRDQQLSQSLQVRPDGKITLPLIGDVPAAGSTSRELAGALTERLKEYVKEPVVTVIVAETTPPKVYVMGEVNTPGAHDMREPITVLQALALAGGFKDFANTKKIRIQRRAANGAVQTINFNYRDALERPDRPMFLQAGDIVIVP
jgi:polysaccharide biosynthesis/export protein